MIIFCMRLLLVSFCLNFCNCLAWFGNTKEPQLEKIPEQRPEDLLIEEVVLSTEVDHVTFRPAGIIGRSFPVSTQQLYVCFRVQAAKERKNLIVNWYNSNENEPFQSTPLVVTRNRWMMAGYESLGRLESGRYFIRIMTEGETIVELDFEIEDEHQQESSTRENVVHVTPLQFSQEVDEFGKPHGPIISLFPSSTRRIYCTFSISGIAPGTTLSLHWLRGSETAFTHDLGRLDGTRSVVSMFEPQDGVLPGLYRVEVIIDGESYRSRTFTVESEVAPENYGPQVSNLMITTAVEERTGRPLTPPMEVFRGDEPMLYLSLTFSRMPPREVLFIKWYAQTKPTEPIAEQSFEVAGRGSLAAYLSIEEPLEEGMYRVDVINNNQRLGTVNFSIQREAHQP